MLRVMNWNFSYRGDNRRKIDFSKSIISELNGEYPCIVAMQEVTEKAYSEIIKEEFFSKHSYSLNFRKPGQFEGKNRGLGCMIACTGNIEIINSTLINRAPFPERTLSVNVRLNQREFEIICFHSLTGVDYSRAKSAQFATFADYLNSKRKNPIILCCDLNEPQIDHYDLNQVEFFNQRGDKGKCASYILRPGSLHDLQDSYRLWLSQKSEEFEKIKKEQYESTKLESTPLAFSHVTGGKKKRYDYIMVSPHWMVKEVEYRYEEAIQHGGDHAVVVADIEYQ